MSRKYHEPIQYNAKNYPYRREIDHEYLQDVVKQEVKWQFAKLGFPRSTRARSKETPCKLYDEMVKSKIDLQNYIIDKRPSNRPKYEAKVRFRLSKEQSSGHGFVCRECGRGVDSFVSQH